MNRSPFTSFRFHRKILLSLLLVTVFVYTLHLAITNPAASVQKWPMKITKNPSGTYKLKLLYRIGATNDVYKFTTVKNMDVLKETPSQFKDLRFDELASIPDSAWKKPTPSIVFFIYPQSYNFRHISERLLNHETIPEAPLNKDEFDYIITSSKVCSPDLSTNQKLELLVIIKTTPFNVHERQELREQYSNKNLQKKGVTFDFVFFMGKIENKEMLEQIKKESSTYRDIIMGDFVESKENQINKTFSLFHWASAFCQKSTPMVLIHNDDLVIALEKLLPKLGSVCASTRNTLYHGVVINDAEVGRPNSSIPSKIPLKKTDIPWTCHPPYTKGALTLYGFPYVQKMAIGMLFTKIFPFEDAFMGLVAKRSGMSPKALTSILPQQDILIPKDPLNNAISNELFSLK